jgi:hypothetical protein
MWEFEKRNQALPDGSETQLEELRTMAHDIWEKLGINQRGVKAFENSIVEYVRPFFPF